MEIYDWSEDTIEYYTTGEKKGQQKPQKIKHNCNVYEKNRVNCKRMHHFNRQGEVGQ